MRVQLKAVGNPDMRQYGNIGVPMTWVEVTDFAAASHACQKYIREYELGGGNWAGGTIKADNGNRAIGYVSYNGRVWNTRAHPGAKCLWPKT